MTLAELREFFGTDNEEQQATIFSRTSSIAWARPFPNKGRLPQRVRIMTMHGAKGLSGHVAFIPGLEEEIL